MDARHVAGGPVTCRVFALATAVALVVGVPVRVATAQTAGQPAPEEAPRDSVATKAASDSAGGDVETPWTADDRLFGRSGKLRARLLGGSGKGVLAFPFLSNLLKGKIGQPGIHRVTTDKGGRPLTFISLLPF